MEYLIFKNTSFDLEKLKIPCNVMIDNFTVVQTNGFSHASERVYEVALRCENKEGEINVQLLTSKNRFSSLKQVSLPLLELVCGVVLLVKLLNKVHNTQKLLIGSLHACNNSSIVFP
ncbi:hypothetical protein NPIL_264251 [Nephila pilipes]|uniref:Uncharacterized protein n=1 Tax=Nephila pilipes TaxID=299642 RepID=A0A8X6UE06_NEPPI|nr:hypothetical protein NPIL_264251 [Nephila pilipes]